MPKVSVILTSYNHAKYIRAAIDSTINQTFTDFELIIWDDCSSDNSWELINKYSDSRIMAFRNEVNEGPVYGVDKAISAIAKGEYIAIHHSDDVWMLDKLEKQVSFLDSHPEVGAVFSQAKIIDDDGASFADSAHYYNSIFRQKNRSRFEWLRYFFFSGNCLCHPSALVRRSAYRVSGLYDPRLGQIPDFDMWIRMCMHHEIHILDEPLVKFRVRAGEANQSGRKLETTVRVANERILALRNYTKIENEQDLHAIFPELQERFPPGAPPPYQLAIHALESGGGAQHAFGLELLYMLMANERNVSELEQYGFGYKELIEISGRCDFFRSADLFRMESDLHRVKSTFSWRVTKPLRGIWNLFFKIS